MTNIKPPKTLLMHLVIMKRKSRHLIVAAVAGGIAATLTAAIPVCAQSGNGWKPLATSYSVSDLGQLILPEGRWQPFPNIHHPDGFSRVPLRVRQAYIHAAEGLLDAKWPPLPATVFLEFARNGNRSDYEHLSFERRTRLATLVLAEAFERKGRFTDQIVNGIWAICEESFWGVPAHLFLQKAGNGLPDVTDPAVGLFAAETAEELAWTYYLLKPELDKVSPLVAKRIVLEEDRRIFVPYLRHSDWGYLGFQWKQDPVHNRRVNNWNPWINSNVLAAALVLAPDSLRLPVVHKTMASIDNFVIPYPADGGSDEGPEYWGRAAGSLLVYLELLNSASAGKINLFDRQVLKNMSSYIYKMSIAYPWYINYGDADAKFRPEPALLYRFGRDTHDSVLMHFAAFQAGKQHFGDGMLEESFGVLNRALPALFVVDKLRQTTPADALVRDVWLPDIQVMAARSEAGSTAGFYLAAKGGDNGASHNHNDVGNFVVYYNGSPVLIDAGAQTYTAKTFSNHRYELWNNQSAYHNLPDINGIMQQDGKQYTATGVRYSEDNKKAVFGVDIAKAYPENAGVSSWIRTVTLNRGKDVTLEENYTLKEWKAPVTENFLTPLTPALNRKGAVTLRDDSLQKTFTLSYDPRAFVPHIDTISVHDGQAANNERDGRMYRNWGGTLYRVRLTGERKALKGRITVKID